MWDDFLNKPTTRLHSSRMRTARVLTVSPSMLCSRGVYLVPGGTWSQGGVLGPRGVCLVQGGVPGLGGAPGPRGYLVPGGHLVLGGCTWSRGVYLVQGVYLVPGGVPGLGGGVPGQVLPPVDRHTPVNLLPCPKLRLRAVKM